MEIKDSLFDNILDGKGTKENLSKVISNGTISLTKQIKVLYGVIRLAIHETKTLELTDEDIKNLEQIDLALLEARFDIIDAQSALTEMITRNEQKSIEESNKTEDILDK